MIKKCRILLYFISFYINIFIYRIPINTSNHINNDKYLFLDHNAEVIKNKEKDSSIRINNNHFSIRGKIQSNRITTHAYVKSKENNNEVKKKAEYKKNSLSLFFPLYVNYFTDFSLIYNHNNFTIYQNNNKEENNSEEDDKEVKKLKTDSTYLSVRQKIDNICYAGLVVGFEYITENNIISDIGGNSSLNTPSSRPANISLSNFIPIIGNLPLIDKGIQLGMLGIVNLEIYYPYIITKLIESKRKTLCSKELYHNIFLEFNILGIPFISNLLQYGHVNFLKTFSQKYNNLLNINNFIFVEYPKMFFSCYNIDIFNDVDQETINVPPYFSLIIPIKLIKNLFKINLEIGCQPDKQSSSKNICIEITILACKKLNLEKENSIYKGVSRYIQFPTKLSKFG